METHSANKIFELATELVCYTSQNVFLTGKAGTGKTTFLHHIRQKADKNIIVAAPTGVAAINAGGVTLHSLMQLPFEPFIPNEEGKKKLDYHFKLRKSKIDLLKELELLIIDEVSMLRADILDAIDYILRRYRNNPEPFGGVQILFIGDMYQLPPVVQNPEWELLKQYYTTPFFFHAHVIQHNMPLYVELKKIYRQQDQLFIDILNRIRNNCATVKDLEILNLRYNPRFNIKESNNYIVLCSHNYKADQINNEELNSLTTKEYLYTGKIKGDFAENSLPTEMNLTLKVGAQIIFVKNDTCEVKRFYNGKLGIITNLENDKIRIRFENNDEIDIEPETWRNVRYVLNTESGEIEEEEIGAFTQYPIRLAWAITIHKSQGLTFTRVAIDAGQAFAPGQVYVALSRCTSLDGIILLSRITQQSIRTDKYAIEFSKNEQHHNYLLHILNTEKPYYCKQQLKKCFDWSPFVRCILELRKLVMEKKIPNQKEAVDMMSELYTKVIEQQEFTQNFEKELDRILSFSHPNINISLLIQRVQKAALYFYQDTSKCIIEPLRKHIWNLEKAAKVKAYLLRVKELETTLTELLFRLKYIYYGNVLLTEGLEFPDLTFYSAPTFKKETENENTKTDTKQVSLSLFNDGNTVDQVANERNLSVSTIETHLLHFVLTGELTIGKLLPEYKIDYLLQQINNEATKKGLKEIKESLSDDYTYFDIKVILNFLRFKETQK